AHGKEAVSWVSVRSEANRLLSTLPPQGLEHYRLSYGAIARDMLNQAKSNSDPALLAQVAQRYLYTDAGQEAANLLATYLLDRGQFAQAALWFERLLQREGADKVSASTLVKAALAFHRNSERSNDEGAAKYKELEEDAWKSLSGKAGNNVRLGDRTFSISELREEVKKYKGSTEWSPDDWAVYGGNASRSALGSGDKPFLEKRWWAPGFHPPTESRDGNTDEQARNLILNQAVKAYENRGQAILPAFFPIAADGKLIYRSFWGIHAVELKTGKLKWEADSKYSLQRLHGDGRHMQYVMQWAPQYINMGKPNLLYENSVLGALSTDNSFVYAVEDLAVPPYIQNVNFGGPFPNQGNMFGDLNDAVNQNKLQAYNLKSGKMAWEVGGPKKGGDADKDSNLKEKDKEKKDLADLTESFFLGPPLPLHGKLYVLIEKQQDLRLVCLEPRENEAVVVWAQTLATTQNKLVQDVTRRTQACHLAYGEGILVCPTNAGAVLGVDLLSHSLVWAHAYRDKGHATLEQQQMMGMGMMPPGFKGGYGNNVNATEWKVTAPIIQDGKVVFTAPDGNSVHCLNLSDGSLVWQAARGEDDLYLGGVVNAKVLIVSKKDCRALSLADGKQVWRVSTGLPSGQGVASDNLYYLPLKSRGASKDPEVCAIDVEKGNIDSETKSRVHYRDGKEQREVPGNLLLYEGDVISQTLSEVDAFPQLKVKLAQINQLLEKDPNDPAGLTERGEVKLDKGDRQGAVDDLRAAIAKGPPQEVLAKAHNRLYDAYTEYLQRDFNNAEKYLDEYKALCAKPEPEPGATVPATDKDLAVEQQRRMANYLCLVAEGRRGQGRLTEAFDYYEKFGALADPKELLSVVDELPVKAPADVWAAGRITAMMADKSVKPEQRQELENLIAKRWDALKSSTDTGALRKFVAMFGSQFKVGREARLVLAERLMEESGTGALPEAERQLLLLRVQQNDPQLGAEAVETLARLLARKGLLEDAAYYYRVLGHEFAEVKLRDGRTGRDYFDDLATDKRFLPYLDEPGQVWTSGKVSVKTEQGQFQQVQALYTFESDGEPLPYFRAHRVALELNMHQFRLMDRRSNAVEWQSNLTRTMFQNFAYQGTPFGSPRFPYHTVGHVVVLNLGTHVFGIDPINHQVLWEKNLLGAQGMTALAQIIPDPKDDTLLVIYQDGWAQKIGQTGPIEASYVCLQTRDGLIALEPVSGRTLWTRSDVSTRCSIFGDADHVFVVEMNNDGQPSTTRALRAADGVTDKDVPEFTAVYQQRQRVLGRRLLASDTVNGKVVLRLYDIPSGKDIWKREFAANTLVLRSEQPNLAGAVEPDGKATVVDLATGKEVLQATLDAKHLEKAQGVTLVQDRDHTYVAINGPSDPNANPWGGAHSGFLPQAGVRSVPVNGMLYAFHRDDPAPKKPHWIAQMPYKILHDPKDPNSYQGPPGQMMLLEQINDLPVLMFVTFYQKLAGNGPNRWVSQGLAVTALDKRTGKMLYDQSELTNGQQFYSYNTDLHDGKIEMITFNMKMVVELKGAPAVAESDGKK
ncbi:MAG TPA: PQQ-binding-like beta-propeller repeat protein, partial [Gemmataceae bacterium]|nr:PQQ-binding-like beta-propeller repeat protein [Gemmataceae bacterium]